VVGRDRCCHGQQRRAVASFRNHEARAGRRAPRRECRAVASYRKDEGGWGRRCHGQQRRAVAPFRKAVGRVLPGATAPRRGLVSSSKAAPAAAACAACLGVAGGNTGRRGDSQDVGRAGPDDDDETKARNRPDESPMFPIFMGSGEVQRMA
jgi:hypothetical protein